jgi:hypothetical protein
MATAFWDVYGVIMLVDFIPPSSTVNAAAYQETLNRLKEAILEKRPGLLITGVILHDNAQPHTAVATVNSLNSWSWEILPHQPYCPALPPLDFRMFSKMKKYLSGQ